MYALLNQPSFLTKSKLVCILAALYAYAPTQRMHAIKVCVWGFCPCVISCCQVIWVCIFRQCVSVCIWACSHCQGRSYPPSLRIFLFHNACCPVSTLILQPTLTLHAHLISSYSGLFRLNQAYSCLIFILLFSKCLSPIVIRQTFYTVRISATCAF